MSVKWYLIVEMQISSFVLLFQNCFGYLGSLEFPHEFQDGFFYFSKHIAILVGITLHL